VSRRAWLLFAAMCVIWGMPYLFIKVAVDNGIEPAVLVFSRTTIGAALLLPIAVARHQLAPLWRHWRVLLIYTAVEIGVPWLLLSDAEHTLNSSLAGLLIAGVPLVGVVLAGLVGGEEHFDARRLAGLLIGLGGVALLFSFDVGGGDLRAIGEMVVVTIAYAAGPLIISRRLRGLPPMGVVSASLALTAIAYAPYSLTHLPQHAPGANVIAAIAVLAVVCTSLAFIVFFALIAEAGPVRATVITYVNPAVAVTLGVLVLGERFTVTILAAFVLILGGSVLATGRSRLAQPQSATP
jgi:drug/metabolite transporter (DMT)-like permease